MLSAGCPELFSQVLEGDFRLYKGRPLSDLEQSGGEVGLSHLYDQTKNSLHLGSDEGAEIIAVYHSIISTVKLQGSSAWDYLGNFFTRIFNGCRDFLSLALQNIDLAVCQ